MSKHVKILLDVGDGLQTSAETNKAGINYEDNGHIVIDNDGTNIGVYVDNLNGGDGSGSSVYDGYTMFGGTARNMTTPSETLTPFPDIDHEVCQLIFTLGLYWRLRRNPTSIDYTATIKNVDAMCNEMNAPCWYNYAAYTSFRPSAGEIIQLVENPNFRVVTMTGGGTIAVENGDRSADGNMKTKVMFVITEIHYNSDIDPTGSDYIVHDMKLKCIYSDNITEYVVGEEYSGNYRPTNITPGDLM